MAFVTNKIESLLDEMPNQERSWMLGVLFDLCDHQQNLNYTNNIEFEQFYSLGVGPLRTAAHGTINVNNADNVWDLICAELEKRRQEESSKDDSSFLCSFQELHIDLLGALGSGIPS